MAVGFLTCTQLSHGRRFFDLRNVQKCATKSENRTAACPTCSSTGLLQWSSYVIARWQAGAKLDRQGTQSWTLPPDKWVWKGFISGCFETTKWIAWSLISLRSVEIIKSEPNSGQFLRLKPLEESNLLLNPENQVQSSIAHSTYWWSCLLACPWVLVSALV